MTNARYVTWTPGPHELDGYDESGFHEAIMEYLKPYVPSGGSIFDYGAGFCKFLSVAKRHGYKVSGVNPCVYMAEWATSIGIPVAPVFGIDYQVDQQYDLIVSQQTFEHLLDPKRDLAKIVELLKPGGHAYIEVPNWRTFRRLFQGIDCQRNCGHYNYFTPATFRRMVEGAGLRVVENSIPASTSILRTTVKRILGVFGAAGACSVIAKKPA